MISRIRIGLLFLAETELNQSIAEQVLGVRLAADYAREQLLSGGSNLDLIERQVANNLTSVDEAARELVYESGCNVLLGALTVPLSIRAAEWAEEQCILYVASNNNPKVRDGRHYTFHIGVPSEVTANAVAGYLINKKGSKRVHILHTPGVFQIQAAACTARAIKGYKIAVADKEIGESGDDRRLWEEVRAWKPDTICIYGSETDRLAELVTAAHNLGGLPRMHHPRGLICREFVYLAAKAAEGHEFTDIYFRNNRAPEEEKALHGYLDRTDSSLLATASHGFGWDGLRLLVEAWRSAGLEADRQVEFLESLSGYSGATGLLTFSAQDHNGRRFHDPTTITRLSGGRFLVVETLKR
jgi:ABC-type branched-subunit amino acid transport system substrate-binding protein